MINRKKIEILKKQFEFSVRDIAIGTIADSDEYFDMSHKRGRENDVTREYVLNDKKITLYTSIKNKNEGKYLLQDVAYNFIRLKKIKNTLLVIGGADNISLTFEDKKKYEQSNRSVPLLKKIYTLFFITTNDFYNKENSIKVTIELDYEGNMSKEEVMKIISVISFADYTCNKVCIISNYIEGGYELDFLKDIVSDSRLYLKENDMEFLNHKEVKTLFDNISAFRKSTPFLKNSIIAFTVSWIFILLIGTLVEDNSVANKWLNHELRSIDSKTQGLKREVNLRLIEREQLLKETAVKKIVFKEEMKNL